MAEDKKLKEWQKLLESLCEAVIARTKEAEARFSAPKDSGPEVFPNPAELGRLIQDAAGASKEKLKELIAYMLKIDPATITFPEKVDDSAAGFVKRYPPGTMLVPLANGNGHSYSLGLPALVYKPARLQLITMSGAPGNTMDSAAPSSRWATEAEIRNFFLMLKSIPMEMVQSENRTKIQAVLEKPESLL